MEAPQYIGILYALGAAYEESGDRETALEKYTEVSVLDGNYRDVAEKLNRLEG
jgi:predicted Zn-dependent protease